MAAPEYTSINLVRGGFGCTAPGTAELPKLLIDLMGYSGGYVGSRGIAASGGLNAMETVGGSFVRLGGIRCAGISAVGGKLFWWLMQSRAGL